MHRSLRTLSTLLVLAAAGASATAEVPTPPPMPSARLAFDVDVKPASGKPGLYALTSVVTDLETNTVIAKPMILMNANKPARVEIGNEAKWLLRISVTADGAAHKAAYEASFTREGQVVSQQKLTVNLDG